MLRQLNHEEFKLNSELQFRSQKKKKVESRRNRAAGCKNFTVSRNFATCKTDPPFFDLLTHFVHFWFFLNCPSCNSGQFNYFCNFAWLGQYISSYYTIIRRPLGSLIKFLGRKLSALPNLSHFLSFSLTFSYFITSQTPYEDDNSKDEWLETFPP